MRKIEINSIPLYLKREDHNLLVWPAICPHEGAELTEHCFVNKELICPWHNLKFAPCQLSANDLPAYILGLKIIFSTSYLITISTCPKISSRNNS